MLGEAEVYVRTTRIPRVGLMTFDAMHGMPSMAFFICAINARAVPLAPPSSSRLHSGLAKSF